MEAGDAHKVYARYHRWLISNTYEGVANNQVRARAMSIERYNMHSYLYFEMSSNTISMLATSEGQRGIALRAKYYRQLDTAWYWQLLTKGGATNMSGFHIQEVMVRG